MFTEIHIWLIVGMSLLSGFTPGPGALAIAGTAMARGHRHGFAVAYGMTAGAAIWAIVAGAGLGAVLIGNQWLFETLKYVGAAYLIYLGITLLRSAGRAGLGDLAPAEALPARQVAIHATMVTALNPKGIVFFIAFLPQFIAPESGTMSATAQLWLLGGTFVVLGGINAALYAVFALSARRFLTSPARARGFNLAGGGMLCAAGLWALAARRPV